MHDEMGREIRFTREELSWLDTAPLKVEMHNCMMKMEEIQEIQGLRVEMSLLNHAMLKVEIVELQDEK